MTRASGQPVHTSRTQARAGESAGQKPADRRARLFIVGLLLIGLLLGLWTAATKSITHDELWHLPVGLKNLREGRFDIDRLNPPLSRMWAAVPLALAGVSHQSNAIGSANGKDFTEEHPHDFMRWYVWGRAFHLAWWLLTGVLLAIWSWQLLGRDAACLAVLLFACCPNLLGHGAIVTPDVALSATFLGALYAGWRWWRALQWRWASAWGAALGLALGVKFTAVLLYPVFIVIVISACWKRRRELRARLPVIALQAALGFSFSILLLALSYGLQGLLIPLSHYQFASSGMKTAQAFWAFWPEIPVPLPADYLWGIDQQRAIMESPHPVFLDGEWSLTGFRDYYWKTLLYKLPHLTQLLLITGLLALLLRNIRQARGEALLFILAPSLLLLLIATGEGMQLGIRYVLPVLPLLLMAAGASACGLQGMPAPLRRGAWLVIAVLSLLALRHQPDHLAYFNELAGGPIGGREHLLDSNLDWGQDLYQVPAAMRSHKLQRIGLAYFGTVAPQLLGIEFDVPPSWEPVAGWYAVSVNYVMGRPHVLTQGDGTSRGTDFQEFGYFRFFQPVTCLGGSIDVYHLTDEDVARWNSARERAGGRLPQNP